MPSATLALQALATRVLDNNRYVYTAKSGWEGDGELERWRHVFLAADVSHARPALEGVEGKDALDRHWVPAALPLHPQGAVRRRYHGWVHDG